MKATFRLTEFNVYHRRELCAIRAPSRQHTAPLYFWLSFYQAVQNSIKRIWHLAWTRSITVKRNKRSVSPNNNLPPVTLSAIFIHVIRTLSCIDYGLDAIPIIRRLKRH